MPKLVLFGYYRILINWYGKVGENCIKTALWVPVGVIFMIGEVVLSWYLLISYLQNNYLS